MRWTAQHWDGFTSRLLSYTLRCDAGAVELEADWFRPEPSTRGFRARFPLDDSPLVSAMPALRLLRERYESPWDDMDDKSLVVEGCGPTVRVSVYGGGMLVRDHPELRAFLDLFAWLEGRVVAHLPWPQDANPASTLPRGGP